MTERTVTVPEDVFSLIVLIRQELDARHRGTAILNIADGEIRGYQFSPVPRRPAVILAEDRRRDKSTY